MLKNSPLALGAAALALAAIFPACKKNAPLPSELATPQIAIARLQGKRFFFNADALPFVKKERPDLFTPAQNRPTSFSRWEDPKSLPALAAMLQNPTEWRKFDRQVRFDAVLLAGDPATFRPLLEHLAGAADWTLTYLDPTSFVFERSGARAWQPGDVDALRKRYAALPAEQQADLLVQLANKLLAIKQREIAKPLLNEATKLHPNSPAAWTALALYHVQLKQNADALAACDQALARDKNFVAALETKTQILLAMHRAGEAFETSRELIDLAPDDVSALYLRSRAAHEAHAYTSEITALTKLIARLQATGQSPTLSRVYLGQAYAEKGEAKPALEQLEAAFAAPDLPVSEKKFVAETIARIKERSGM